MGDKIFYTDLDGEEEEITFAELQEKLSEVGPDGSIEIDWIDDDNNIHFQHTVYGMYY